MFVILLPVVVKMESVQQVLCMVQQLFVMKLEAEAKAINKETKTFPANFNEKKASCKMQNFYILFTFY